MRGKRELKRLAEPKTPLPPFAALRAFHAAAVHGRFRDAALSLGVTESSISHQVRHLEDFLRTALFDRSGPGVRLTVAGQRYLDQIDPAIRQIQSATEALLRKDLPADGMRLFGHDLPVQGASIR